MKKILIALLLSLPLSLKAKVEIINVIGDSYVANHREQKSDTWHYKLATQLHLSYNNYGKNGACVAFDRSHDGQFNFGPAMYRKTSMLAPDADYVIIIGGHNDAIKVGRNADSLAMFRDSLELLITNIQYQCPKARIGYVTPWYVDKPGFPEICRTIKKVCARHKIPVLDNYKESCIVKVRDESFRRTYFQSPNDDAHLNAKGHDLFLPIAKKWFEKKLKKVEPKSKTWERETIWPKGKMPHAQSHQIAAMTDETSNERFSADKHRISYLEWFESPSPKVQTGTCAILVSGGSYENCCDVGLIRSWHEELTKRGVQCVNFVYRTPRPKGLPIYQTAWEDAQRAVRLVRSEAKQRGFDPERIGVVSMSAGSHLALLMATNSQTASYMPIDALDTIPCHINWVIAHAPAYLTNDAESGTPSMRQGYGSDVGLSSIFNFDNKTCPVSLHHGGRDIYSPNGSTLFYRELRRHGIPAELHLFPNKGHGAYGLERGLEFLKQLNMLKPLEPERALMERFSSDDARKEVKKQVLWPAGKTPNKQSEQCEPYLEWHFPKDRKSESIQIIYSGGAYNYNDPDGFEVAPVRRYLNEKGMTVVTLKYRTPRPSKESGLAKHTTAWQDLQRAIRLVRNQAPSYGLDPKSIGIMGSSAGGHLTLLGTCSSLHQTYLPIDSIDHISCSVQWGIAIYPAYVLTDGHDGHNHHGGNEKSDLLVSELIPDLHTSPILFIHGDADNYSSMGSVKLWEHMRAMGIQSELHTLATRKHCFQKEASPETGSYTYLDRIWEFIQQNCK